MTDTAKAVFDVEDFEDYVSVQSEAALRHLAMAYSYDTFEGETLSLRGSVDEVSGARTILRPVRAATVRERFLAGKLDRFLTGAARKKSS